MKNKIIAVVITLGALVTVGCTGTLQDLKGVEAQEPDSVTVFQAPDLFPNIARTCIDGVAIMTTTRDGDSQPIPAWDEFC